jgi:hypothetical protein
MLDPYIYKATWEKQNMSEADWLVDNVPKTYLTEFKDEQGKRTRTEKTNLPLVKISS